MENIEAAYLEHRSYLLAFLRTRTYEPEDVLSITFLKACIFVSKGGLVEGNVRAWLFMIARNTLKDQYRDKPPEVDIEAYTHLLSSPGPEVEVQKRDRASEIWAQVSTLPPRQEALLREQFLEDYSLEASAELHKISAECVKQGRHRARTSLRTRAF